jgi:hypothetical protein
MASQLRYVRATKMWLKDHASFNEAWVRDIIREFLAVEGE